MELYQHDRDFTIKINGQDLMSSPSMSRNWNSRGWAVRI
jgi:hypothetical protein